MLGSAGEVSAKSHRGSGSRRDLRMFLAERGPVALGLLAPVPPLASEQVRGFAVDGDVADPHVRAFVHAGRHTGALRSTHRRTQGRLLLQPLAR